MNKEDIIKALEYCSEHGMCDDCPYQHKQYDCSDYLKTDALDLIKNQQAEIERLEVENAIIIKQAFSENRTNATVIKAEFEQQRRTTEYIKRLEAEIERLEDILDKKVIEFAYEKKQEIKIEAYKEFTVKLLALIGSVELSNLDLRRHINNLANELTERKED